MKATLKLLTLISIASLALVFSFERSAAGFQPFVSPTQSHYKWNVAAGPVRWSVLPGAPELVRESMLAVTKNWSEATAGVLTFEEGAGGISLDWDATGTRIVDTMYLAYTFFNADNTNRIYASNITINALNFTWQRGGASGVGPVLNGKREANMDTVLMHEVGHALGLDHSDKNAAGIVGTWSATDLPTMNSIVYPGAETLHSDDDAGIQTLYGAAAAAPLPAGMTIVASPLSGKAPLNVSFTTNDGSEAMWDFGNGKKLRSGDNLSQKFTAPGTYTVTATAGGKSTTITIEVEKKGKRAPKAKKERKN